MKFVILIHSNPQPWGHPTSDFLPEYQSQSTAEREQSQREFESFLTELHNNGELIGGEALADPADACLFRWQGGSPISTSGPYAESKEHFAGYFMIDVADRDRAEQVAAGFSGPGETVELRATMRPGGDDA